MAVTTRLDHDLDPNGNRILGGRGAGIALSSSGDLVVGRGNFFRVYAGSGATTIRRISVTDWTPGSAIDLQLFDGITIVDGESSEGTLVGIVTQDGLDVDVASGRVARFVFSGDAWVVSGAWPEVPTDAPSPYPGPMTPVGSDYAGDPADPRYALGRHSHPMPAPPAVSGQKLYTANIADPTHHPTVRFVFTGPQTGTGGEWAVFGSGWVSLGSGMWRGIVAGRSNFAAEMCDGVTPADGDRFFAGATSLVYAPQKPNTGLYRVIDCGEHIVPTPGHPETPTTLTTYPIVQRVDDADSAAEFEAGIWCVVQEGTIHGGLWVHLLTVAPITLGTTALAWEEVSSHSTTEDMRLLTWAQLGSVPADTTTIEVVATQGDNYDVLHMATLGSGGLGLTSLPAGRDYFQIENLHLNAYPTTGAVWVTANIYKWRQDHYADKTLIMSAPGPLLYLIMPTVVTWPYDHSEVALDPLDNLAIEYILHNTTGGNVTITLRWSSSVHGTWWQTTAQFPSTGGTDDHRDLKFRDALAQHPSSSITAGEGALAFSGLLTSMVTLDQCLAVLDRPTYRWNADAWGVATIDGAGVVTVPLPYRKARFAPSGTTTINGINPIGWADGQECTLLIAASSINVTTIPPRQPGLATNARLTTNRGDPIQVAQPALLRFVLDAASSASWIAFTDPLVF